MAEYTPMQVKQAVVGYGKAEKRQVMEMTRRILHLEQIPKPDDAADPRRWGKSVCASVRIAPYSRVVNSTPR